jgi:hypothetical protein
MMSNNAWKPTTHELLLHKKILVSSTYQGNVGLETTIGETLFTIPLNLDPLQWYPLS